MLETLKNAWKIPDLRKRITFTVAMLVVFRVGAFIPVPGINKTVIQNIVEKGGLLGFFDVVSGGAFKNFTIFALSITPYITASIIMQLLTIAIPKLEELAKEGEEGRKKIAQFTRYGTVVLALVQSVALSMGLRGALYSATTMNIAIVALTLTAGTAFLMWLGEQITDKGIGNGISLLIFAGIISRLPDGLRVIYEYYKVGTTNIVEIILFAVLAIVIIAVVVAIQQGTRKIPVQYAKRVVGRKMYGGQSTHIPIKVNQAGVIPVIFATSLLAFPQTIGAFFPNSWFYNFMNKYFAWGGFAHTLFEVILIVFFTYFYTAITFNPIEVANNLKKYGGFIPGIRPGKPTVDFINKVLNRITLVGAFFLVGIIIIPVVLMKFTGLKIYFGGTALLIVVGVALETMKQIEAQMLMRHYQGFLK
ncbi:MAG: Protein translocase subunit SecY [Firmicutes bacterium]|nr:Protein translocase subunit SecY [Bacillota bacterium]MDI6705902.1 preprotein translocase subunit SecY [Bacillota bacterium]